MVPCDRTFDRRTAMRRIACQGVLAMSIVLLATGAELPVDEKALEELSHLSADEIAAKFEGKPQPEAVRMLLAIKRGSMMGAGEGWFGPAQTRYSWEWLAARCGVDPQEGIPADKFPGDASLFQRLDRNRDGKIVRDDLDWSDRNPWVQQAYLVNRLFRAIDPSGDGRLTEEEWRAFFDKARGEKDHLSSEDLRDALLGGASGGFLPGDAPSSPDVLVRGLLQGEVGSIHEGPRVDEPAPDFALKTFDARQTVRLSEQLGEQPVVLVFGNFTCGPFRSMYPAADEVYRRYKDQARF